MKNATPQQLIDWQASGEVAHIDVREVDEYQAEHIAGAINAPLSKFTLPEAYLSDETPPKIIISCLMGGRSARVCQELECHDPDYEIWNLEGGIKAWKESGLPVEINKS